MLNDLMSALTRNPSFLVRDFAGATVLAITLVVGLSLPGFV